ncbi:MAG TPA: NYN domain-containing protein [Spirochaetia bacterium]|nr:NYN domain-containing protein [Spirochaetia bacterium]
MNDPEYLLVDGYNVIYSWPDLKGLPLEHARDKLLGGLAEYGILSGMQVMVVFDAHHVRHGTGHVEEMEGVTVVYTREGETADSFIERLSGRLPPGRLFVVTADACEQMVSFGRGAFRVTPLELKEDIRRVREEAQSRVSGGKPADRYLENYLLEPVRSILESLRRKKT